MSSMLCDGTGLTASLQTKGTNVSTSSVSTTAFQITRRQLLRYVNDFTIIDIREADEKNKDEQKYVEHIVHIPMGKLMSNSFIKSQECGTLFSAKPKICFICQSSSRAAVATQYYNNNTMYKQCYFLKNGFNSFKEKFSIDDNFAIILSNCENDSEKVGIALNLANSAAHKGKTTTLILMHDATWLGTKSYHKNGKLQLPKPFKDWKELFNNFLTEGFGQLLLCTSCLKKRDIEDDDIIEQGIKIQGPDVIDIIDNVDKVLQFI